MSQCPEIKQVTEQFSVSGQLSAEHVPLLVADGIKTLVCNRPDNEVMGQPPHGEIEARALELGMKVHYLPVVHDTIKASDVAAFSAILAGAATPVHAWCRSGLRSITLWSLAQVKAGADPDTQVARATALGFDFRSFKDKFAHVMRE